MSFSGKVPKVDRAVEFLRQEITGVWRSRRELIAGAARLDISESTLEKAAHILGVEAQHIKGSHHGETEWLIERDEDE